MKSWFAAPLLAFITLAQAEIVDIDNDQLTALRAKGLPVVDVRTAGEWHQTGVVEGSQMVTLVDETGRSEPELWKKQMAGVADPNQPVVLICRSGNRSMVGAKLLAQQNPNRQIFNVRAGINGWLRASEPVVTVKKNLETAGISCTPRC
jgi:rhodanese-related sulfurtransferase